MPFPGEIAMRSSTTLFDVESSHDSEASRVPEAVRTLVGLIGQVKAPADPDSFPDCTVEEVLVDTEVDGSRYLLIRMPEPIDADVRLSPREQEIVRMVAKGHPNKVIADVLNISSWTVCTHLRRIFAKLNVTSRAAMVGRISKIGALNSGRRQEIARFK
jgi:DNA-binding CsgD family transcriptional regulator